MYIIHVLLWLKSNEWILIGMTFHNDFLLFSDRIENSCRVKCTIITNNSTVLSNALTSFCAKKILKKGPQLSFSSYTKLFAWGKRRERLATKKKLCYEIIFRACFNFLWKAFSKIFFSSRYMSFLKEFF